MLRPKSTGGQDIRAIAATFPLLRGLLFEHRAACAHKAHQHVLGDGHRRGRLRGTHS
jgi:hypothetical protein